MAYWMKDKTDRALSLTGLDQPLKQMDAKAAQSWEEAENMRRRVSDFYILLLLLYNNFLHWNFDEKCFFKMSGEMHIAVGQKIKNSPFREIFYEFFYLDLFNSSLPHYTKCF